MAGGPKALEAQMEEHSRRTEFLIDRLDSLHESTQDIFANYSFESMSHFMKALLELSKTRNNDGEEVSIVHLTLEQLNSEEFDLGFPTILQTQLSSSRMFIDSSKLPTYNDIDSLPMPSNDGSTLERRILIESQLGEHIGKGFVTGSIVNIIKYVSIGDSNYHIIIAADPTVLDGNDDLKPYPLLPSTVEVILIPEEVTQTTTES